MESFFGVTITEDAIHRKNHERQVMRRYLELGKLDPAPMSGYEMGTRIDAGSFSLDLDQRCRVVEERTAEVLANWEANLKGKPSVKPRLLVTGYPNAGVREKIIRAVEEMGADIVIFDTCSGIRDKIEMVDHLSCPQAGAARRPPRPSPGGWLSAGALWTGTCGSSLPATAGYPWNTPPRR